MMLQIEKSNGKPFITIEAETEAERFRLQSFKGELIWANVSFDSVNDNEGDFKGLSFGLSHVHPNMNWPEREGEKP